MAIFHQLEHMSKFNKGKIVNLASIAGLHGVPFVGSYAATKHAVSIISSLSPHYHS